MAEFTRTDCARWLLATLASLGLGAGSVLAQEVVRPAVAPSGGRGAARVVSPNPEVKPGGENQPKPGENPGAEKKPEEKPGEKKPDAKPATVERPKAPEKPADPKELDIAPDTEGMLSVNFSGQTWPAVLEWLAKVSSLSLDWQELPSDYLNLRTQRKYTISQVQDLINRHLLMRGFTMLKSGELLTVAKVDKLNPALLPRVEPADLASRMDYEFVKVSFPLVLMTSDQAVEELKPLLSSNGKLTSLKNVNRVEAMDSVINLRDLAEILGQAQSKDRAQQTLVREFRIKHRRAGDVMGMVQDMLGMERKGGAAAAGGAGGAGGGGGGNDAMSRQIMQQMQQMQQMIQQQAQQRAQNPGQPGGGGGGGEKPPEPKLVLNEQENSLLITATPDKMEVIVRVIEAVDTPSEGGDSALANINRIKGYRLSAIDPQALITLLRDMGDLSPMSRLQVDEKTRSLIVSGTLADHYTVKALVDRLDGSTRSFEVVQLRRVQADAVAGTIQYLMGAEDEKKETQSRYVYYYGQSNTSGNTSKEERPFKVDADVDKNRLLLWANPTEMEEVKKLLVKMGEVAPGSSNPETLRSFELDNDEQAEELLKRIRELWPEIAPNQLLIQPSRQRPSQDVPDAAVENAASGQDDQVSHHSLQPKLQPVAWQGFDDLQRRLRGESEPQQDPVEAPAGVNPPRRTLPPITIQRGANGKLVIGSSDTRALDQLEELMMEHSPPAKDYKVFQMKYPTTWAYGIELLLVDFFKEDGEKETVYDPYYGFSSQQDKKGPSRMSRKKKLKILSDTDSNTILVQGATPDQLKIIEDLITVYDRPLSSDPQQKRTNRIFKLEYSKAEAVGETLKQVYRDLLSVNDPALQNKDKDKEKPSGESLSLNYSYGNRGGDGEEEKKETPQPVKFKGLLSVGVDPVSNTVVVSAADGLMKDIDLLVRTLDEFAKPNNRVQVMPVQNIGSDALKARLERTFGLQSSGPSVQREGAPVVGKDGKGENANGKNADAKNGKSNGKNGEGGDSGLGGSNGGGGSGSGNGSGGGGGSGGSGGGNSGGGSGGGGSGGGGGS